MNPSSRRVLAGLLVGGLALAVALWGVPLVEVAAALGRADGLWLLPLALAFLIQQALRALRQAWILQASHPAHPWSQSHAALCVGFLFVNTLPARLGELVRPLVLSERGGIPLSTGLGMVVVERSVDLASMMVMLSLAMAALPEGRGRIEVQGEEIDLAVLASRLGGLALPLLLVGLLGAALFGPRLLSALRPRLPEGRLQRLLDQGLAFLSGLAILRQPLALLRLLVLTVIIWALTIAFYPLLARAFGIQELIGMREGLGVLGVTMLGMALPAAPGFAGTYEAFVRGGLGLYGVGGSPERDGTALAYALTMHWWVYLVQAATGLYFLLRLGLDPRQLWTQLRGLLRERGEV